MIEQMKKHVRNQLKKEMLEDEIYSPNTAEIFSEE
jgi:hypothetical protein